VITRLFVTDRRAVERDCRASTHRPQRLSVDGSVFTIPQVAKRFGFPVQLTVNFCDRSVTIVNKSLVDLKIKCEEISNELEIFIGNRQLDHDCWFDRL
jgi:hypothetical protein